MEWTNKRIMEFLELLKTEPALWDFRKKTHVKRGVQNDAWNRIVQSLSFEATIDDLKRKKESLMGYYRIHLNKYKRSIVASLKSGDPNDVYTTNWFAFNIMHSFLESVYASDNTSKTESEYSDSECPSPVQSSPKDNTVSNSRILTPLEEEQEIPVEVTLTEKPYEDIELKSSKRRYYDEYDHFAFLIAAKLRKITDEVEKETVMNTIQNLVFQAFIKNRNSKSYPS